MPRTALVVDDSASLRALVAFTLKEAGFHVVEASDGQNALERLDAQRVDLIVTDLNMPRLDGVELIRSVRARPASQFTPVLVVTTESQAEKRQQAHAAGASGWVVKPFRPAQLLQAISSVLP